MFRLSGMAFGNGRQGKSLLYIPFLRLTAREFIESQLYPCKDFNTFFPLSI